MNVLLDMHMLGVGMLDPNFRRGIYRYVENLTASMAKRREINLSLCASDKWQSIAACSDYLMEHPPLKGIPFIQSVSHFDGAMIRKFKALDHEVKFRRRGLGKILLKMFYREPARSIIKLRRQPPEKTLTNSDLEGFDIYFSPNFPSMPEVVRRVPGIRNFVVVHDVIPLVTPQYVAEDKRISFAEKLRRLNREDWIFTISNWSRDDLCNHAENIDPDRVIVNPIAAADHFYPSNGQEADLEIRKKYGIPADSRYLLSLGALEERKNLPVVFEVFEKLVLQEKFRDLSLVLVGHDNTNYTRTLKSLSSYGAIHDRVLFTGHVPDEDLSTLYSCAEVFLFPSHYEGFGLPPLEAMQCGVPVVASNSSSLPEVVGDAGVMTEPNDSDGMAQAVLKILTDSSYRKSLSERSIDRARQFSWDRHALKAVKSFERVKA